ncbi:YfdX family protein [Escherichia coli]|uniref:YfdX family protein n=1 Tax=Escherichia coli TaxID=562 RepID=UPI001CEC04F7|nr:YfdX family protein [Escherichia coli]MCP8728831.1 YfdX family protein [Escherichia coli]MCT6154855.1 YfdX family protein [Escherichia coli]MCT6191747.1 YfdX family protein [Escherichia coli]MCT6237519.1 YfdX family protein [Escherichia coli]MCT6265239.1 YfdX family protein [Escherichia coli]
MKHIFNAVAIALSLTSAVAMASATSENTSSTKNEAQTVLSERSLKAEQRGMEIMDDMQYARLALFSGDTGTADRLINRAEDLLKSEDKTWETVVRKDKKTPQEGDVYIIINSSLMLSEDFTVTSEKQKAIDEANKKLDKGDKKGAIEVLHLAGIDISETQWLMPLKQTQKKVNSAQKLMREGKYYEANLALKGAEDGVITDTVSLNEGN